MAFKLRSPLHVNNPFKEQSKEVVARHAKAVENYKPGSKANPTYGTAENMKQVDLKEKGERTNFPLEKPKPTKKAKSNLPASQGGGSPLYGIGQAADQRDKSNAQEAKGEDMYKFENNNKPKTNLRMPRFSVSEYMKAAPGNKFAAATAGETSSFPSKITSTTGGASNLDFSKGDVIGQYDKGKSKPSTTKPSNDGVMVRDAEKNNAERIKKTKPKPSASTNTNTSTKAAKPITSSDSGKSSYKSNMTSAEFFGKDYSKELRNSTASMPKFDKTVTNARSADYDMIRAKGRGKIDRLKTRLDKREGRVANRVEASSNRIKSRQKRSGNRYASKMEARTNTGTNPGYSTEQKKLDAFEKTMDSPKAASLRTPKSNQTVAKPSMKLNTSVQTTGFIDDSKIKKGAKNAKDGRINEKVSAKTYKSATGLNKLTKKAGPSGGMERGMPKSSTSITKPASGPRAKTVKVESGPSKREKAIMNAYNNIRK